MSQPGYESPDEETESLSWALVKFWREQDENRPPLEEQEIVESDDLPF